MSLLVAASASAFAASLLLTGTVRRYALSRSLLDLPSERSSHTVPTPRGGGLAIVVVVLSGIILMAVTRQLPPDTAVALAGGGAMVAVVGWLDDRRSVTAWTRLLVHLLAAIWAVWWLGGMPFLTTGDDRAQLGVGGSILAVVAVIWAINFYNFMDGIDGLAAGEAVSVGLVATGFLAVSDASLAGATALIASAAAGFLPWNWAQARIFMGDVGSGFLGFLFGALTIASENAGALPALVWLVLLGVFVTDATVTLLRRIVRGERWYSPHRTHAYQRAVRSGLTHRTVSIAVMAINLALGGLAYWALGGPGRWPMALAAGGAGLSVVYLWVERRRPMFPIQPRGAYK